MSCTDLETCLSAVMCPYARSHSFSANTPKMLISKAIGRATWAHGAGMGEAARHDDGKTGTASTDSITRCTLRFIDLFAGIGGIRKGFELACDDAGIAHECVFTSEIKPYAVDVLKQNHPKDKITGDITKVAEEDIPDCDIVLAGFPCQAFSTAGKRRGFEDTRGTLFFDVARIIRAKQPMGFVLENVEGLVTHDRERRTDRIGRTLSTILKTLEELGYSVTWKVINAADMGVPQSRRRIYIVGTRNGRHVSLDGLPTSHVPVGDVLEHGLPLDNSEFVMSLLSHFTMDELVGKQIKDKRGGSGNIHSWDFGMKGDVTAEEKRLMDAILAKRRNKCWAEQYGIRWMDGMPLTTDMIRTFWNDDGTLQQMLDNLVMKGYLVLEHPKDLIDGRRQQVTSLPLGYNIVTGKLSFRVNQVLDPNGIAPTLVAMDMSHIYVPDGTGIRPMSLREGLRMFGYPDDFKFDVDTRHGYDLLGNTVVVPVIRAVSSRLLTALCVSKA